MLFPSTFSRLRFLSKGFYPFFRFYSPKKGLFDGTWKLPDIE